MRTRLGAAVVCLVLIGAGPASQPSDYPALRAKLAELTATVDRLNKQLDEMIAENATLKAALAKVTPTTRSGSPKDDLQARAMKLHAAAMDGGVIYHGRHLEEIEALFGKADDERREGVYVVRTWSAGDYRLVLTFETGRISDISESGTIPH